MIVTVWLSGENESLARAEVLGAALRLGGSELSPPRDEPDPGRVTVECPDRATAVALAGRLALAHRCAEPWLPMELEAMERRLSEAGRSGAAAAFQWVSKTPAPRPTDTLQRLGAAYRSGGGRISLDHPTRRYWVEPGPEGQLRLFEEAGVVDRTALAARSTPHLPFQRPVTLAPRLARALVNMTRVGPGDRVVDPFLGTGSLLVEAAMLGARTVGVDVSASMVQGALQNFAHLGQSPEVLRQADAAEAASEFPEGSFDALVTDPPYGRASGTRGEAPERLWSRALVAWTTRVRPGGRLGIVVPAGAAVPDLDARLELAIPQRVHRSLTREFRVYRREAAPSPGQ